MVLRFSIAHPARGPAGPAKMRAARWAAVAGLTLFSASAHPFAGGAAGDPGPGAPPARPPARDAGSPTTPAPPALDPDRLRTGDLIFRRGRSRESLVVTLLDDGSPFSHVGLIEKTGDTVRVIHVLPGTPERGGSGVRREPLSDFAAPGVASAVAVYRARPAYRHHAARAVRAAASYLARGLAFDDAFDAGSAEKLYCTELVWRAYGETGLDLIDGRLQPAGSHLAPGSYVLLSALMESPYLTEVPFPPDDDQGAP
jgi:hypothetical protein